MTEQTYVAEISRRNPTCVVFLIDQSGSMMDPFGRTPGKVKAQGVADALNSLLQNLVLKCVNGNEIREYIYLSIVGYGGANASPALLGALKGKDIVSVGELAHNTARTDVVDDGNGGQAKRPVWFDAVGSGETPMKAAFEKARAIVADFLSGHQKCFPPIVINITDGIYTGEDPTSSAESIGRLSSEDGNVLLFNLHIADSAESPVHFPDNDAQLRDQYAKWLFNISSTLPAPFVQAAIAEGFSNISSTSRGFVYNGDFNSVVKFFNIGTDPARSDKRSVSVAG
jgi:uncharacterized protein YegL